jgi:DNA (cytosine-5)-methyltransferase 1
VQLACHKRLAGFYDVYGRMAWDDVSPTITSGFVNPSKGRFLHPTRNRTITLREAALLQTFPRDYWFSFERGKYPVAALIGNALPPRFIETIAARLVRHLRPAELNGTRRRPIENGRVSWCRTT